MPLVPLPDDAAWAPLGTPGCEIQSLIDHPTGAVKAFRVQAGGCGPSLHYHSVDQLIAATDGGVAVEISGEAHMVHPGEIALIPAGVAHRCANPGPTVDHHLEFFLPPVPDGEPLLTVVDTVDDAPGSARDATLTRVDDGDMVLIHTPTHTVRNGGAHCDDDLVVHAPHMHLIIGLRDAIG